MSGFRIIVMLSFLLTFCHTINAQSSKSCCESKKKNICRWICMHKSCDLKCHFKCKQDGYVFHVDGVERFSTREWQQCESFLCSDMAPDSCSKNKLPDFMNKSDRRQKEVLELKKVSAKKLWILWPIFPKQHVLYRLCADQCRERNCPRQCTIHSLTGRVHIKSCAIVEPLCIKYTTSTTTTTTTSATTTSREATATSKETTMTTTKETTTASTNITTIPKETTTIPKETTILPKETTTPSKETTTTPKETTTLPKETTLSHKETTTPSKDTTTTPKETTTPPKETTITPKETTKPSKDTTTTPKELTTPPKETTISPKETTITPKETTIPTKKTTIKPKEKTITPKETTTPPKEKNTTT